VLTVGFTVLGGVLFSYNRRQIDRTLAEQMLHRQQVTSRIGARSITSFIDSISRGLVMLANCREINGFDLKSFERMQRFIDEWDGQALVEVVMLDAKGEVLYSADRMGEGLIRPGVDSSDRDYFVAAKELDEGEIYVGAPIFPRAGLFQGSYVLIVAIPIVEQGEFRGVIVGAVLLSDLTTEYLNPLKISEESQIYILNKAGLIMFSPIEKLIGQNYFDLIELYPYPGSDKAAREFKLALESEKDEGKLDLEFRDEATGEMRRYLLAYSHFRAETLPMVLAVSTPVEDAMVYWHQFRGQYGVMVVFWVMVVLVFTGLLILVLRFVQRDAYEDGWEEAREYWKARLKRK